MEINKNSIVQIYESLPNESQDPMIKLKSNLGMRYFEIRLRSKHKYKQKYKRQG